MAATVVDQSALDHIAELVERMGKTDLVQPTRTAGVVIDGDPSEAVLPDGYPYLKQTSIDRNLILLFQLTQQMLGIDPTFNPFANI